LATLICAADLRAQDPSRPGQQPDQSVWDKANQLMQAFQKLGPWEEHHGYMIDALENVFEQNGWNSEPDQFALDLTAEVESLPPWDYQGRFNALASIIGDRYLLSEEQQQQAAGLVARESFGLFMRHSDRIMDYSLDMLKTRASGEAITPEQVARWVELAEPVLKDGRERMTAVAKEFGSQLDPEQQQMLQRDLGAANRRLDRMEQLSQKWKRGEWSPEDWGIADDPIQLEGEIKREMEQGEQNAPGESRPDAAGQTAERRPGKEPPDTPDGQSPQRPGRPTGRAADSEQPRRPDQASVVAPADEHEWARYVRDFIRRYDLNEAQQNRAWAIYRDVRAYGDRIEERVTKAVADLTERRARTQDADALAKLDSQVAAARQPLDRIFEQMKRRLDRLPTRAQRVDAEKKAAQPDPSREARPKANRRADGP
jgi:hypothetical protein